MTGVVAEVEPAVGVQFEIKGEIRQTRKPNAPRTIVSELRFTATRFTIS